MRRSEIERNTSETKIKLSLNLDGAGRSSCETGCGFLDHMLTLFAKHGRFDLDIKCDGDTFVDYHHTVEDVGICLGQAFSEAMGDKKGINRYAEKITPMDETLILCAVDVSGRGGFYGDFKIPTQKVGDFDTELCEEFFLAFTRQAGVTLHAKQLAGSNSHHIIEGAFKCFARAMREALSVDEAFADEIPSTKGML
ncbi:MAG: imidazoleglycerol-phosphate dehydratase HisB [Clostridia bacterium]|nr:imidazoleglycerol-phosphate dehydratase HisB [Clostridia bacterium]